MKERNDRLVTFPWNVHLPGALHGLTPGHPLDENGFKKLQAALPQSNKQKDMVVFAVFVSASVALRSSDGNSVAHRPKPNMLSNLSCYFRPFPLEIFLVGQVCVWASGWSDESSCY